MPRAIDLYCGLGGWTDGLLAEGYRVIGFDIERHLYGDHSYPAQLVVQDVLTLHGSQFKDVDLIVASPPCQEYSYMAMPWTRAKQIARALRGEDEFPDGYKGSRTVAELNTLFDACFRLQREASKAAGRHIPMVVENVRGAQPWAGRAAWNFGSYYLWGDVPALMPIVGNGGTKNPGLDWSAHTDPDYRTSGKGACFRDSAIKNNGGSWFNQAHNTTSGKGRNPDGRKVPSEGSRRTNPGNGARFMSREGCKGEGAEAKWFDQNLCVHGSKTPARKAASAMIAKIPFELSRHIAAVYRRADRDGNRVRHLIPDPCHLASGA